MDALDKILKKIEIIFKLLDLKEKAKNDKVKEIINDMITSMMVALKKEIDDLKGQYQVSKDQLEKQSWAL